MPKKILLIDDEELVIKSVSRLLSKVGFETIICRSGEKGIESAKAENIALIICDIRMPGLSGIEVIKKIREFYDAKGKARVPEILITGFAEESANKEAEALQVAEYIYKPFDLNIFIDCVKKNLKE